MNNKLNAIIAIIGVVLVLLHIIPIIQLYKLKERVDDGVLDDYTCECCYGREDD